MQGRGKVVKFLEVDARDISDHLHLSYNCATFHPLPPFPLILCVGKRSYRSGLPEVIRENDCIVHLRSSATRCTSRLHRQGQRQRYNPRLLPTKSSRCPTTFNGSLSALVDLIKLYRDVDLTIGTLDFLVLQSNNSFIVKRVTEGPIFSKEPVSISTSCQNLYVNSGKN